MSVTLFTKNKIVEFKINNVQGFSCERIESINVIELF